MKIINDGRIKNVAGKFVQRHFGQTISFREAFYNDLKATLTRLVRRAEQETWWKAGWLEPGPAGVKAEEALRPCPFCWGEPAGIYKQLRGRDFLERQDHPRAFAYYVACNACYAQGGWADSSAEAVRRWNGRP